MRRLALLAAVLLLAEASASPAAPSRPPTTDPAWSPNGKRIAWVAGEKVWTARPDGSRARSVTRPIDSLLQLAWTRASGIVYDADFRLFRVRARAGAEVLAKRAGESFSIDAAGTRAAWGSAGCPLCHGPVVVLSLGTGKRVSIGSAKAANVDPSLAPDGLRVAFARFPFDPKSGEYGGTPSLWAARTDGGRLKPLGHAGLCPSWSPRGDRIAFLSRSGALLTMPARGGRARVLLAHGVHCGIDPAGFVWSPDGRKIALLQGRNTHLAVLDVAARRLRRLPAAHLVGLAWSPSSKRLLVAARTTTASCSQLWVVAAEHAAAPRLVRRCD